MAASVLYLRRTRPIAQIIPPPVSSQNPPSSAKVSNRGLPTRLNIPKIAVDAAVSYVGITEGGAMGVPANITDVSWYKHGPLPGNVGSAVISGHVDGPRGEKAVFWDLDKLQPGDTLSITDSTGQATTFVVREVRTYDQNEQPSEVFTSAEGAHLNLITCAGAWDTAQRQFLKRLVVFTDKSN